MTDYTDLKRRGITVWTLDGEYDLWSMQHPEGRHKDEYEGQRVKAEDANKAIASLEAALRELIEEADDLDWSEHQSRGIGERRENAVVAKARAALSPAEGA